MAVTDAIVAAAEHYLRESAHTLACEFRGCTCGATEQSGAARAELARLIREHKENR